VRKKRVEFIKAYVKQGVYYSGQTETNAYRCYNMRQVKSVLDQLVYESDPMEIINLYVSYNNLLEVVCRQAELEKRNEELRQDWENLKRKWKKHR
jgi:hypothetical protein